MASVGDLHIAINFDVKLSFWAAVKLRIAGAAYAQRYFAQMLSAQEDVSHYAHAAAREHFYATQFDLDTMSPDEVRAWEADHGEIVEAIHTAKKALAEIERHASR